MEVWKTGIKLRQQYFKGNFEKYDVASFEYSVGGWESRMVLQVAGV